jgi:choline dehydrogenase
MRRANLRVVTGALVTRVLFEGGRATGVEYRRGGQVQTLRARAW